MLLAGWLPALVYLALSSFLHAEHVSGLGRLLRGEGSFCRNTNLLQGDSGLVSMGVSFHCEYGWGGFIGG